MDELISAFLELTLEQQIGTVVLAMVATFFGFVVAYKQYVEWSMDRRAWRDDETRGMFGLRELQLAWEPGAMAGSGTIDQTPVRISFDGDRENLDTAVVAYLEPELPWALELRTRGTFPTRTGELPVPTGDTLFDAHYELLSSDAEAAAIVSVEVREALMALTANQTLTTVRVTPGAIEAVARGRVIDDADALRRIVALQAAVARGLANARQELEVGEAVSQRRS